jgi:hypothetical protein
VDVFVVEYNTNRPHQSLDMDFPADRFRPRSVDELGLRAATVACHRADTADGTRSASAADVDARGAARRARTAHRQWCRPAAWIQ